MVHDLEEDLVQVEVLVNQQSPHPWLNCVIVKLLYKKVKKVANTTMGTALVNIWQDGKYQG